MASLRGSTIFIRPLDPARRSSAVPVWESEATISIEALLEQKVRMFVEAGPPWMEDPEHCGALGLDDDG